MAIIHFGEILYASTEKSCISGSAGFGIRALNSHILPDDAERIVSQLGFRYDLPTSRMVRLAQIQEDPSITTRYPRSYLYNKVRFADGGERYVLACATYVGIDYGYFCGKEQYQRVGNNYIADFVVLEDFPGSALFQVVGDGHTFEPIDNTCRPDNLELQRLLTGEPTPLVDEFIDTTPTPFSLDAEFAMVVKALLQAYINRSIGKDSKLTKVIIKVSDEKTTKFIQNLQHLPSPLVEPMFFISNYLQGYGVPEPYKLVFINEYNKEEMYEDDYITIDFFTNKFYNIDQNFIFDVIDQLVKQNQSSTVLKLLDFITHLSISTDTDYEFIYKLYKLTQEPELGLSYSELNADFFTKLRALNLPDEQLRTAKDVITKLLNSSLQSNDSSFLDALRLIDYLRNHDEQLLDISTDSRQNVADVLFNKERALQRFSESGLIPELVTYIINDNNFIESPEALFKALQFSNDIEYWQAFIDFYYSDCLADKSDMNRALPVIVGHIINSNALDTNSRQQLISHYYPIETNAQQLYDFIVKQPDAIDSELAPWVDVRTKILSLPHLVEGLIKKAKPQVFSQLILASGTDSKVVEFLTPLFQRYFSDGDIDTNMKLLKEQLTIIAIPVINKMLPHQLLAKYANHCYQHPIPQNNETVLKAFTSPAISIEEATRRKMRTLLQMYSNETLLTSVGVEEMLLAKRMNKDGGFQLSLFKTWLAKQPLANEINRYLTEGHLLSNDYIEKLILTIWESKSNDREKYILGIIDSANWNKDQRESFLKSVNTPELSLFINKQYAWWRIVLRKLIGKNK